MTEATTQTNPTTDDSALDASQMDMATLFTQFLNTCNSALAAHRDQFPYKQIMKGGAKMLGDRRVAVAIYKDDPKNPYDFFTIQMEGERFVLLDRGKQDPDITWRVKDEYVRRVAENPETYVENPAKLDWHWLTSRMGLH